MNKNTEFYKSILDNLYDGVYYTDRERRLLYWNKGAENLTGYRSTELLGKQCHDNLLMHVDDEGRNLCFSGCPVAATIEDGKSREAEVYLHHKDGHRVPVAVRVTPIFDDDGNISGAAEVFHDNSTKKAIMESIEELKKKALLDELTNVGNRRYAEMTLNSNFNEYRRYGWDFGVGFLDIDHFKSINDQYGHSIGDRVLRMVSGTLMNNLRSLDCICRWGGEEFLLLVKHIDRQKLKAVMEKLRILVQRSHISFNSQTVGVTVSIGATMVKEKDDDESIVERADGLMYMSKQGGRNRVYLD